MRNKNAITVLTNTREWLKSGKRICFQLLA